MLFKKRSTAEGETVTTPKVGSVIPFAGYDWRVLDVKDGKALLISEKVLKKREYRVYLDEESWETCRLREYLNIEFFRSLDAEARARISATRVVNDDNPKNGTPSWADTTDKIFLLSIGEAEKYFHSNEARVAYNLRGRESWWWLRSSGLSPYAAAVDFDGGVEVAKQDAGFEGGVRPALWLNLRSDEPPAKSEIVATPKVGSIIPFADYDWRVLDVKDGKALLISEKILEERAYNDEDKAATWKTCTLRSYLNKEFYDLLPAEARARISKTKVVNNDNPKYGTPGGKDTTDKICLLSIEEAEAYFGSNQERVAHNLHGKRSDFRWWWLRSPGMSERDAARVEDDGSIDVIGAPFQVDRSDHYGSWSYTLTGGVRPALWINLK
jgi:hypothetical protein